jgi:hypothetical protein
MGKNKITLCPKRIVEGGIEGTHDLGECLFHCAAFQDWTIDENSNPVVAHGYCKELGDGSESVTARVT